MSSFWLMALNWILLPVVHGGSSFHISTAMDMDYLNETYYSTDDAHEDYLTGGLMTYNDGSIWDLKTFVPGNHFSTVKHVFHPPSKTFIRNEHVFEPDWYVSDGELVVANGEGETSLILPVRSDMRSFSVASQMMWSNHGTCHL